MAATPEVLSWYRDFLPAQHEDLYGFFAMMTIPPGDPFPELHLQKACGVVWCYTGDPADVDAAFAPVREMQPQFEGIGSVPYPGLQAGFDALYPKGLQWYWRGDFVRRCRTRRWPCTSGSPTSCRRCTRPCTCTRSTGRSAGSGGADTAWSHRDVTWSQVIVGVDPDPANAPRSRGGRGVLGGGHPYSAGGAYVNFMMDEGQDRVRATYQGNYERLAEIKGSYDPENIFRINQNIYPPH